MNNDQITLINITNGNRVTVFEGDSRYDEFKRLIIASAFEQAEAMDVKATVQKFAQTSSGGFIVSIHDGVGSIRIGANNYPLADVIVSKILKIAEDGFDTQPLVNFISNLYKNPSKTAIDELFLFLDQSELPITEDGCFIAYKIVRNDYMDIYSGKFDNSVGKECEMARFEVDDKRDNTCSNGLHFCSKGYLPHYGQTNDSRCMLVKINPMDVVSIPSDYDNAKGRTCRYVVVGEVDNAQWREQLSSSDFTSKSVVSSDGSDYVYDDDGLSASDYNCDGLCDDCDCWDEIPYDDDADEYWFDPKVNTWRNATGHFVSKAEVAAAFNVNVSDLDQYK